MTPGPKEMLLPQLKGTSLMHSESGIVDCIDEWKDG